MKTNQRGFGIVGILAIVAIVGIVGALAWVLYDRQANEASKQEASVQSSKEVQEKTSTSAQKYLEIKEEGIKIKLSEPILDAYVVAGDGGVAFGVSSLDNIPACKVQELTGPSGPFMNGIARLGFDKYAQGFRTDGSPEESAFKDEEYAVRVGDNWYEIYTAPGDCKSTDTALQEKIEAVIEAFRLASKTITAL